MRMLHSTDVAFVLKVGGGLRGLSSAITEQRCWNSYSPQPRHFRGGGNDVFEPVRSNYTRRYQHTCTRALTHAVYPAKKGLTAKQCQTLCLHTVCLHTVFLHECDGD
jgi:hypothetical protein